MFKIHDYALLRYTIITCTYKILTGVCAILIEFIMPVIYFVSSDESFLLLIEYRELEFLKLDLWI